IYSQKLQQLKAKLQSLADRTHPDFLRAKVFVEQDLENRLFCNEVSYKIVACVSDTRRIRNYPIIFSDPDPDRWIRTRIRYFQNFGAGPPPDILPDTRHVSGAYFSTEKLTFFVDFSEKVTFF
uniref:Uncharacterized protein n=1 Tax=Romanomermis culicivorax TaxID=13658 RepID=A0A915INT3_ROMCU